MEKYESKNRWLAAREGRIGASMVPAIMGVSPYDTAWQLYHRIKGNLPRPNESFAMRAGKRAEPLIDKLYCEESGRLTAHLGDYTIQTNKEIPFLAATLDRVTLPCESREEPGATEFKLVSEYVSGSWSEEPPPHVWCQVQAQLAVTGFAWGVAVGLIGIRRLAWFDIDRHEKFVSSMLERIERFLWQVAHDREPEPTAADNDALYAMYPEQSAGKVLQLPDEAASVTAELADWQQREKEARQNVLDRKARLKAWLGDNERGLLPDGTGWTWKSQHTKAKQVAAYDSRVLRRTKT